MFFLIDENLPVSFGKIFQELGFVAQHVSNIPELRTQPDEAIFDYAVDKQAIIVTRDLGFANPIRFPVQKLSGLIIFRFPNEILVSTLSHEAQKLISNFQKEDFHNLIVIEPGSVRKRKLS